MHGAREVGRSSSSVADGSKGSFILTQVTPSIPSFSACTHALCEIEFRFGGSPFVRRTWYLDQVNPKLYFEEVVFISCLCVESQLALISVQCSFPATKLHNMAMARLPLSPCFISCLFLQHFFCALQSARSTVRMIPAPLLLCD